MRVAGWVIAASWLCAQTPEAQWREAVSLHQKGDWTAAAAAYESFLRTAPRHAPARSNLGAVYARLGRYDDAIRQYQQALQLRPADDRIRLNLALAYQKQGRLDEVIVELEPLVARETGNRQAVLVLGDSYLRLGENRKLIRLLTPWEAQAPDDRAIAYLLGTALVREGDVARGQPIVNRLFRTGESAENLLLLGSLQFAAQENKKALQTLAQAVAKQPDLPELQCLYGRALLTDGNPEAAKQAFLRELAAQPDHFDANLHLGSLLRLEQDFAGARLRLNRARQARPHSVALQYQLGSLELSEGHLPEALKLLENVTKEAPDFVEGHISLATVYYRLKRKAEGDRERATVDRLNAAAQKKDLKQP
jgi:predicted Zn-dependent protease